MALDVELRKKLKGGGAALPTGGVVQEEYVNTDVGLKYAGREIILPDDPSQMSINTAITFLRKIEEEQEHMIDIIEPIEAYKWDGAHAFTMAMQSMFGHSHAKTKVVQSMFGEFKIPPKFITIEVGHDTRKEIIWGTFELPGFDDGEYLETGITEQDNRIIFCIYGNIKRKRRPVIAELAELTRKFIHSHSIYRGKAVELPISKDGKQIDHEKAPRFINLGKVNPTELLFSKELERIVEANLFQMITHPDSAKHLGVPSKRTICLAGTYGTGKTMTAMVAAKLCEENDRTFFYIKDVRALADTIKHARGYGRVVVFAEDFDRVASGDRGPEMDTIVNVLDGIDKDMEVIVVLTTNHPKNINSVFRRSGRVDITIEVTAPDAEAVHRLIHQYGRGFLDKESDFNEVAAALAEQHTPPSNIREVVEGAKLYALARAKGNEQEVTVNPQDLLTKLQEKINEARCYEGDIVPEDRMEVLMKEMMETSVEQYFINGGGDELAKKVLDVFKNR